MVAVCGTLGQEVRVELPGGDQLVGVAEAVAPDVRKACTAFKVLSDARTLRTTSSV